MSSNQPPMPVALITGGALRIGKQIAKALHRRGINVVIHYNHSNRPADKLTAELNELRAKSAIAEQADLAIEGCEQDLISQTIRQFGRLDFLVNNASAFYPTPFFSDNYNFEPLLQINLRSPIKLAKAAQPHLSRTSGAILNLIDIYARAGLCQHSAYVASKSGLLQATRQLAVEMAPEVRVNGISPGAILWPDTAPKNSNKDDPHAQAVELSKQQSIIENTALMRIGAPQDISATAEFLLLDASYITGQTIAVDGGRQLYI